MVVVVVVVGVVVVVAGVVVIVTAVVVGETTGSLIHNPGSFLLLLSQDKTPKGFF